MSEVQNQVKVGKSDLSGEFGTWEAPSSHSCPLPSRRAFLVDQNDPKGNLDPARNRHEARLFNHNNTTSLTFSATIGYSHFLASLPADSHTSTISMLSEAEPPTPQTFQRDLLHRFIRHDFVIRTVREGDRIFCQRVERGTWQPYGVMAEEDSAEAWMMLFEKIDVPQMILTVVMKYKPQTMLRAQAELQAGATHETNTGKRTNPSCPPTTQNGENPDHAPPCKRIRLSSSYTDDFQQSAGPQYGDLGDDPPDMKALLNEAVAEEVVRFRNLQAAQVALRIAAEAFEDARGHVRAIEAGASKSFLTPMKWYRS